MASNRVFPSPALTTCPRCSERFEASFPQADDRVSVRRCSNCSMMIYAAEASGGPVGSGGGGGELRPYRDLPTQRPAQIEKLIVSLNEGVPDTGDRRACGRIDAVLPLVAIPLRQDYMPAERAVRVATRNLSVNGASLTAPQSFAHPLLLLDFSMCGRSGSQSVMKVLRQHHTADGVEVSGEFLTPINHPGLH